MYGSVSAQLADDIQELFIKIGKSASIRIRPCGTYCIRGKSGVTEPQYWVSEWTCPHGCLRNSKNEPNFGLVHDGMVYCVAVPNGTLIVRRHGKPMIAGNCVRYLAMFNPRWIKPNRGKVLQGGAYRAWNAKRKRIEKRDGGDYINLGPGKGHKHGW